MDRVIIREFEHIEWTDSLVLVAFPSTGSVASIAGHYLQQKLDLPLVGCFLPQPQAPIAAVRDGISTSPIRIFGGEVECELPQGGCPRLYLILTDLPLSPESFAQVSYAILDATKNARLLLCMDGIVREAGDDTPDVWAITPDRAVLPYLDLDKVKPLQDAFIGGMTGQILLDCMLCDTRVGALVVEALKSMPDGRAAAALIKAVDQLLPLVPVDAEPLVQEALKLEAEVRHAQEAAERQAAPPKTKIDSFV